MKKLKLPLLFVLLCAFVCTLWATPVSDHGALSVSGNKIVDKNGKPVQLRGMSLFWNTSGWGGEKYYTAGAVGKLADVADVADGWAVSVVRAAIDPGRNSWDGNEAVINAAIDKGIYVIIDWHSHNAHSNASSAVTYFTAMAKKYKNTPNVIYEIYNEPLSTSWSDIKTYANSVISAIRDEGDNNLILVGTRDYSKRVDDVVGNAATGANVAYVAHYYSGNEGHGNEIRGYIDAALKANLAVFVTEFGISMACGGQSCTNDHTATSCNRASANAFNTASGGAKVTNPVSNCNHTTIYDTTAANEWFRFLDQRQISWVNWSINDKTEAASALTSGNGDGTGWSRSFSGNFIHKKLNLYAANPNNKLTVNVIGEGSVARSVVGVAYPAESDTYGYGVHVELTATPAPGWEFVWSGAGSGTTKRVVGMYGPQTVTARFVQGGNLIKNGNFTENTSENWSVQNDLLAIPQPRGDKAAILTNNELTLLFTDPARLGTALGHSYLFQKDIALKKGRRYKLSFDVRGEQPREINVAVCDNKSRSTKSLDVNRDFNSTINLKTENQSYELEFDAVISGGRDSTADGQVEFWFGANSTSWYLTNVMLFDIGAATGAPAASSPPILPTSISPPPRAPAAKTSWSVAGAAGGLRLSGPAHSGVSKVSLYDVRGRLVKSVSLKSGQILKLNKTAAPAGSYLLVVKNGSGKEVYRMRVSLVN